MAEIFDVIVITLLMFVPMLNMLIGAAMFGVPGFLLGLILTAGVWMED